jgi:hypothetical protein
MVQGVPVSQRRRVTLGIDHSGDRELVRLACDRVDSSTALSDEPPGPLGNLSPSRLSCLADFIGGNSRAEFQNVREESSAFKTITWCASVNLDVLRGSEPHLSQSYHNRVAHLRRVAPYAWVP